LAAPCYLLRHSEAYELGVSRLQASTEAVNALGAPISTGYPLGSLKITGASGRAILSFSATGPKATGQIFLEASKKDDVWVLKNLTLKVDGREGVIDLLKQSRVELGGCCRHFV
jgi:hypothetical protein